MFPREFFDTYWRTDLRDEVFVAMPFHKEFDSIWQHAIKPAIETGRDKNLRPKRVDVTTLSGSVIIEILDGIAHSRLILADISIAREGKWVGQRNGNVMYEVGLAHAIRQAPEIVLVRSDEGSINFDLAQISIHSYDRNDLAVANSLFSTLITDALRQVQLEKSLKVARAIDLLDSDSMYYLSNFASKGPFAGPAPKTRGDELSSIPMRAALSRLQQLGIVRCIPRPDIPVVFEATEFGKAVIAALAIR